MNKSIKRIYLLIFTVSIASSTHFVESSAGRSTKEQKRIFLQAWSNFAHNKYAETGVYPKMSPELRLILEIPDGEPDLVPLPLSPVWQDSYVLPWQEIYSKQDYKREFLNRRRW